MEFVMDEAWENLYKNVSDVLDLMEDEGMWRKDNPLFMPLIDGWYKVWLEKQKIEELECQQEM